MKTGLKKSEKTTEIFFDEASPVIEIHTHNTNLKNRLIAYAGRFPDLCKLVDEDTEQGYKKFIIRKGRFSFRLTVPYSEERRNKARQLAIESNASSMLKLRWKCSYSCGIIPLYRDKSCYSCLWAINHKLLGES